MYLMQFNNDFFITINSEDTKNERKIKFMYVFLIMLIVIITREKKILLFLRSKLFNPTFEMSIIIENKPT